MSTGAKNEGASHRACDETSKAAKATPGAHCPFGYDDEDEESTEPENLEPFAWVKKYQAHPRWISSVFPKHKTDPVNFFVVLLVLRSSKLFHKLEPVENMDVLLARMDYWYREDPDFRIPLDRLVFKFLTAFGDSSETLADEVCNYCFQIELSQTPVERASARQAAQGASTGRSKQ